jgi:4-amino-4-deoxy-L-arabinose transferase-like glycosyltransferase
MSDESTSATKRSGDRTAPLLLLLAALVGFAWLMQTMAALPFLRGPIFDSVVYAAQGEAVRAGRYGDPTLLAFSPLYGYAIALLGGARSAATIAIAQLAMWVATLWLVHRTVARSEDRASALLAATLCALHGPLLFYTGKLLAETLGTVLAIAATSALLSLETRRGRWSRTIGTGALLALATLARASQLFALPLFVASALVRWGQSDDSSARVRRKRSAGIALGIALVLGGNGLWNYSHTGLFVPVILASRSLQRTTSREWRGRIEDFALPGADRVSPWDVVDQARARIEARQRGEQAPTASVGAMLDWRGFFQNIPRKLGGTLQDREITSYMYSYYGEARESPLLRWFPVSFGVLLALGLYGAVRLARREGLGALAPYAPFFVAGLAACLLYHPSARYRLPMIYPLVFLAGPALRALVSRDDKSKSHQLISLAMLALVAVLVARHLTYRTQNPALWNASVARSHALAGELPEAAARIAAARASGTVTADTERFIQAIPMGGSSPTQAR